MQECLEVFHHLPPAEAAEKVLAAWRHSEEDSGNPYQDVIYHEQPFRMASALAGSALDIDDNNFPAYAAILEKHGW